MPIDAIVRSREGYRSGSDKMRDFVEYLVVDSDQDPSFLSPTQPVFDSLEPNPFGFTLVE